VPRIFPTEQQTRVSGAGLGPGPTADTRGVQALGQSVNELVAVRQQLAEQDAAVWATRALSEAQTQWAQTLLQRQEEAEDGAPDFTPSLLKDYDAFVGESVGKAPTRASRLFMQEALARYRTTLSNQALVFEANQRAAYTEDTARLAIDSARTQAFQDPSRFAELVAERNALIDNMRLAPDQRARIKATAQYQIARDAVAGMVEADATGALEMLRRPAGMSGVLAVEALSATDRANLMEAAERRRLSLAAQAEQLANRREKDVQDATSKQGDQLVAQGQLTARWIEDNRERLSAEDFRYFYKELNGGGETGSEPKNMLLYADLRERASFGQDIRGEARAALVNGDIRREDYDRLLGEVEADRAGWYARGSDYIATSAGVSDLNPDPAAAQRKAMMLDDWAEWSQANPKATDDQAEAAYKRIVTEYAIIDYEQMLLVKRKPRYLAGTRSAPNFDATIADTAAAFERGEITQAELDEQAALIRELEEAWQRAQTK
jgi:hypothetical protein